jgi:prevent-host-death family protein
MDLAEVVKPITYLKNNAAEVVREAAESERLLVVTQNGEAKAVVMGVAQYDEWGKTLALLKVLAQGEADVTAKRVVDQAEAFRRAEASCIASMNGRFTCSPSSTPGGTWKISSSNAWFACEIPPLPTAGSDS